MTVKILAASIASLALSSFGLAKAPNVVTDIAPIHSLATQVMAGIGEPTLLVKPEYSPHEYTLRPSEARALSNADVVFWVGEDYTPWLEKSLENVADKAEKVALMEVEGTELLEFREGATFEAHDHDDHEGHDELERKEHEHHDEHKHDENEHHDEHKGHDEHGHQHESADPHAWLDPVNAKVWLHQMAHTLAEADPENAQQYEMNAEAAIAELDQLIKELKTEAQKNAGVKFIVFHDAYQYFETRFDLLATGAISVSDATDPSPARVAEIRDTVADLNVRCVFTEPQFNANMVKSVFRGMEVYTGILDPLGVSIELGRTHYSELLRALMASLSSCKS